MAPDAAVVVDEPRVVASDPRNQAPAAPTGGRDQRSSAHAPAARLPEPPARHRAAAPVALDARRVARGRARRRDRRLARRAIPEAMRVRGRASPAERRAGRAAWSSLGGRRSGCGRAPRTGGAMDAGGRTWAVAGTGREHCFPKEHASLFERIGAGPGAMIWPFLPPTMGRAGFVLARNRVLVALVRTWSWSSRTGRRRAPCARRLCAAAARKAPLGRPRPAVAAARLRWHRTRSSTGIDAGVAVSTGAGAWPTAVAAPAPTIRPLTSVKAFLAAGAQRGPADPCPRQPAAQSRGRRRRLGRSRPAAASDAEAGRARGGLRRASPHLTRNHMAACSAPRLEAAGAALLTLALEDVVVEGPAGFYRRRDVHND